MTISHLRNYEEKKKAVAYIRVSTTSDSQIHSFEFQEQYWRDAIDNIKGYKLVQIYADRGISGKSVSNRTQFKNMKQSGRQGEYQTIFVKRVSRFARNTEDLLSAVRELREMGINVIFESENIDTSTADSDMQLTLAAAIAEEQLRTYGKNVEWSIRDKFKKGEAVLGRVYGYKLVKGKLEIIEDEAEVVRLIFYLYLQGLGKQSICNELKRRQIKTLKGGNTWGAQTISKMLRNEKYAGHLEQQKSIKVNGILYRNQQIAPRYFVENAHPSIISQEDFDKVQEIITKRIPPKLLKTPTIKPPEYPFTSKIHCGVCGANYGHKINSSGTKWAKPMWTCKTANKEGKAVCGNGSIFDKTIEPLFVTAYNAFVATLSDFVVKTDNQAIKDKLLSQERSLRQLLAQGLIAKEQFEIENTELLTQIKALDIQIKQSSMADTIGKNAKPIDEFDGSKVTEYLGKAMIKSGTITFEFINGFAYSAPYSNGKGGNKPGWNKNKEQ